MTHIFCLADVGRSTTIAPFDKTAIQTVWDGPASIPPAPVTGSGPVNPPVVNPTQYHPPIITQGPWRPPVTQNPWQPPVTYNPYNPAGPQKQTGNGNGGSGRILFIFKNFKLSLVLILPLQKLFLNSFCEKCVL